MLDRRPWARRLYADRAFVRAVTTRWRELRADGLRRKVLAAVEQSQTRLRGAVSSNFRRWPVLDRRIWPNPRVHGSYRAELRFLRSWLDRRIGWIDRNIGRL
jgi:CotH kinase protein